MREIKFRAWHSQPGHSDGASMLYVGDDFGTKHPLDCCRYAMDGQPVTLMQYTGMKDENGQDIYEGDILRSSYGLPPRAVVAPVEYADAGFVVVTKGHIPESCTLEAFIEHLGQVWVDGNIYENPELLEARS